jgi:signal transduction histidine kinase
MRGDRIKPEIPKSAAVKHPLFRRYVAFFISVVCMALLANGALETWFSYQEHKASLVQAQREKAEAAAAKIGQFVREIETQLGWMTQLPWSAGSLEQRQFDAQRLLRQVPAITELALIDPDGREQLRVSRIAMDVAGSGKDLTHDPTFTQPLARKTYHGPIYFRGESEPYMSLALAGTRKAAGVAVAEVNLKFIWDVIAGIKVGDRGYAYVVDAQGRLIAHPDISLVLRNMDVAGLPQVRQARAGGTGFDPAAPVTNIAGEPVLSASAAVEPQGWLVFVETPLDEAYGPLYASIRRTGLVMLGALSLAAAAGLLLARRMIVPIRTLQAGAARIGAGDLTQRIRVTTGDEVEALASDFNDMADRLQASYAELEGKVEARTSELAQSVEELRALGEVSRAVNSTLDLQTVLSTIVAKAVQLSNTQAGAIYVFSESSGRFRLHAAYGLSEETIQAIKRTTIEQGDPIVGEAAAGWEPVRIPDLKDEPASPMRDIMLKAGYRALLLVPLLRPDRVIGVLRVGRREPGDFPETVVELLKTFAEQSVLAIQNARLFGELEEKSHELELVSRHKSQFLANMSHELRTPLNSVLGFSEMLADGIYGDLPERALSALGKVQANGRHLLNLINDVLDLSKIEAGQLPLALDNYAIKQVVQSVVAGTESLARAKGISVTASVPDGLPPAFGDERRITQVVLNLVGNAIKFTDAGSVDIAVRALDGAFEVSVRDTGPGIAPADHERIFDEFQQIDGGSTRKKGGAGLGLAISKRIVEMHGGRISVESALDAGATFRIVLPVRTKPDGGRHEEAHPAGRRHRGQPPARPRPGRKRRL